MEFGIFIQGYNAGVPARGRPRRRAQRRSWTSSTSSMAADKAGFKYVWVTEHHFLDEYSHLSANDVDARLPGARHRAHPPRLGHLQPAAAGEPSGQGGRAGRDARPPLRTAASSSAPAAARAATRSSASCPASSDLTGTREIWEDVIGEFPKMWMQDDLRGLRGQVLVAAAAQDPARSRTRSRIRRCGTPPATRRATRWRPARASACSASRSATSRTWSRSSRPTRRPSSNAEPVGAFVNDNIMVTIAAFVGEDGQEARRSRPSTPDLNYLQSNVFRYHDTFPHPDRGARSGPS